MISDTGERGIVLSGYRLGDIVRKVRRVAELSQRQLAEQVGVSASLVGGVESGAITPSLDTFQRMLNVAHHQLVVVDADGRFVVPLLVWDDVRDLAGRRFPAHLDTILDPTYGEWWGDVYGLLAPPETFRRSRTWRDYLRRKSRWEVRVKQLRHEPPPEQPARAVEWRREPEPDVFDRPGA